MWRAVAHKHKAANGADIYTGIPQYSFALFFVAGQHRLKDARGLLALDQRSQHPTILVVGLDGFAAGNPFSRSFSMRLSSPANEGLFARADTAL
ncbi:hypothetical protein JS79_06320 [Synergistes jonesii]|nr:hypothetical protein JS79_06320 [Synergistes jonesii]